MLKDSGGKGCLSFGQVALGVLQMLFKEYKQPNLLQTRENLATRSLDPRLSAVLSCSGVVFPGQ